MERPDEGGERPEEVAPLRVIKRGQGSIREQVRRQAALRTVSDIRFGPPRTFSPPDFVAPQPSTSPAIDEQAYELARQSASHRVSKILERNPGRLSALANLRREESQTSLPGSITDTHRSSQLSHSLRDSVFTLSTAATSTYGDLDLQNERRSSCRPSSGEDLDFTSQRSSLNALSMCSSPLQEQEEEDESEEAELRALQEFKRDLENRARYSSRSSPRGTVFGDTTMRRDQIPRPGILRKYASAECVGRLSCEVRPLVVERGQAPGTVNKLSMESVGGLALRTKSTPLLRNVHTTEDEKMNNPPHNPGSSSKGPRSSLDSLDESLVPLRIRPAQHNIDSQRYSIKKSPTTTSPKEQLSLFPPTTPPPRPVTRFAHPIGQPSSLAHADRHRSLVVPEDQTRSYFEDDTESEKMLDVVKDKIKKVRSFANFRSNDSKDRKAGESSKLEQVGSSRQFLDPSSAGNALQATSPFRNNNQSHQPIASARNPAAYAIIQWQLPTLILPEMDLEDAVMQAADAAKNDGAGIEPKEVADIQTSPDDIPQNVHFDEKTGGRKRDHLTSWLKKLGGNKEMTQRPGTATSIDQEAARTRARFSFADVGRPNKWEIFGKGKGKAVDESAGPSTQQDEAPRPSGAFDYAGRKSATFSERLFSMASPATPNEPQSPSKSKKQFSFGGLRPRQSMPTLNVMNENQRTLRPKSSVPIFNTVKQRFGRQTIHRKSGQRIAEQLRETDFDDDEFEEGPSGVQQQSMAPIAEGQDEAEKDEKTTVEKEQEEAKIVRVPSGEWVGSSRHKSVRERASILSTP